jgi:hypothetical protein
LRRTSSRRRARTSTTTSTSSRAPRPRPRRRRRRHRRPRGRRSSARRGQAPAATPRRRSELELERTPTPSTAARLEAQQRRALIDGDPGAEPEAELARDREHDRVARLEKRARTKYVKDNLGEDLAHFTGLKWAETAGPGGRSVHEAFLAGELSTDDVEAMAFDEYQRREYRAAERDRRKQEAGFRTGSIPCFVCGRRKPRPSAVCAFCGDDPVTYGGSALELDRAYGYSGAGRRAYRRIRPRPENHRGRIRPRRAR